MEKVLVTGATGFIGSAVVRELIKRNYPVRVTVRQKSDRRNLRGLTCEEVYTDVTDALAMQKALEGCTYLIHAAAIYRTWMKDYEELQKVNVEGTGIVLEAARKSGIKKIIYTSSIGALGKRDDGKPSAEDTPFNLDYLKIPYEISKYQSEKVALHYAAEGLPVVIVRPALVMGAGDVYPTPSGKLVLDIVKKKIPGYFDGAIDVVDVDDVAVGHVLALEKGENGASYNLGNPENYVTVKQLFGIIAEEGGVKPPQIKVPLPLVMVWAQLITLSADYITHSQPLVTPGSIQVLSLKRRIDFSKAVTQLGIPRTPLRLTIRKTIDWYRREGYLK